MKEGREWVDLREMQKNLFWRALFLHFFWEKLTLRADCKTRRPWRGGRVVECTGLENRHT